MTINRETKPKQKKKSLRWISLLILGLALFFVIRLGNQIVEYNELKEELAYYQSELAVAEEQYNEQLAQQELLNNDAYIERLAREKLGMVKEGESVISILDENSTQAPNQGENYDVDSNPE